MALFPLRPYVRVPFRDAFGPRPPSVVSVVDFDNGRKLGREDARRARTAIVWMPRWIVTAGRDYFAGYRVGVQENGATLYPTIGGYRVLVAGPGLVWTPSSTIPR